MTLPALTACTLYWAAVWVFSCKRYSYMQRLAVAAAAAVMIFSTARIFSTFTTGNSEPFSVVDEYVLVAAASVLAVVLAVPINYVRLCRCEYHKQASNLQVLGGVQTLAHAIVMVVSGVRLL